MNAQRGLLYPILRFLYGATERLSGDAIPGCPSRITFGLSVDSLGSILVGRCTLCGLVRITSSNGRGRRWVSTYTHTVRDPRIPRSSVKLCNGMARGSSM